MARFGRRHAPRARGSFAIGFVAGVTGIGGSIFALLVLSLRWPDERVARMEPPALAFGKPKGELRGIRGQRNRG
jgi:uncharacterized membrane protein YfcA